MTIAAMTLLLVLSLGFAGYAFRLARQMDATFNALALKAAQTDAAVKQAQGRLDASRKDLATLMAAAKTKSLAAAAQPKGPAGRRGGPLRPGEEATLLAANPKLRELFLQQFRANLQLRYQGLYQKLGLTPEQIDKFETLATEHADDRQAAVATAVAQGIDPSDPALTAARKPNIDQYYAAVGTEVSPELGQQVVALDRMQGMQQLTDTVSRMSAAGSDRLTGEQSLQLAQILANSSSSYTGGGQANQQTLDWDAAYASAAKVFAPEQIQGLKAQGEMMQISQMVRQYYSTSNAGK